MAARIAYECNETVHLAILDEGTQVLYIAKIDTSHTVRMVLRGGVRLPAHSTAVDRTLLASLDDDVAAWYSDGVHHPDPEEHLVTGGAAHYSSSGMPHEPRLLRLGRQATEGPTPMSRFLAPFDNRFRDRSDMT